MDRIPFYLTTRPRTPTVLCIVAHDDRLTLAAHGVRIGVASPEQCLWALHGLAANDELWLCLAGFRRKPYDRVLIYSEPEGLAAWRHLSVGESCYQELSWGETVLLRDDRACVDRRSGAFRDACQHGERLVRKMLRMGLGTAA